MACNLTRPTPDALFERVKNMFSTTVLGGAPIIPESNEWYAVSLNYAMAEEFYAISEQAWRERDPRTACCENLIEMAALDGVFPRPATFAQGYVKITGTPGASLEPDIQIDINGSIFVAAGPVPAVMPQEGQTTLRVQAQQPGPDGNVQSASTGVIVGALPGIEPVVNIFGTFCGGAEAEGCEPFRTRYLDRLAYKTSYGVDNIKQLVLDWPCVTRVCIRGGVCCDDTSPTTPTGPQCRTDVRLYALFDNTFPCGLAPSCVVDEITEAIFGSPQGIGAGQAEWGMYGKVYTATPAALTIAVTGLRCSSPAEENLIRQRIQDFTRYLCPSEILRVEDLRTIASQVVGTTNGFEVFFQVPEGETGVLVNECGDAVPLCDHLICVSSVRILGPEYTNGGVCP